MECYDDVLDEEIMRALNGNKFEAIELVLELDGDDEWESEKLLIKHGVEHEFNIENVIRKYITEYPDTNHVKIKGYDKFKLHDYWDEIKLRSRLAKNMLRGIYDKTHDNQGEYEDD